MLMKYISFAYLWNGFVLLHSPLCRPSVHKYHTVFTYLKNKHKYTHTLTLLTAQLNIFHIINFFFISFIFALSHFFRFHYPFSTKYREQKKNEKKISQKQQSRKCNLRNSQLNSTRCNKYERKVKKKYVRWPFIRQMSSVLSAIWICGTSLIESNSK